MKSSKLSIKFRITFWYTLVFSLILALVFFYIYFLSKSYSVHDLQEELKDESADILENLYDKSSRNDILYNADWTKFYDDNVSISLYDKNSSFINGVLPEHFPDKVPFINNKVRQIKSDKNIWLVYDYWKIPYGFEASLLMDIGQEFFIICYGFLLFFSLLLFSSPPLSATIY